MQPRNVLELTSHRPNGFLIVAMHLAIGAALSRPTRARKDLHAAVLGKVMESHATNIGAQASVERPGHGYRAGLQRRAGPPITTTLGFRLNGHSLPTARIVDRLGGRPKRMETRRHGLSRQQEAEVAQCVMRMD